MRHVVVQHHLSDADILKVLENCGKIAVILAVCPGCSLIKKNQSSACVLFCVQSTFDNLRNGRRHKYVCWIMSHNFDWKFGHVLWLCCWTFAKTYWNKLNWQRECY